MIVQGISELPTTVVPAQPVGWPWRFMLPVDGTTFVHRTPNPELQVVRAILPTFSATCRSRCTRPAPRAAARPTSDGRACHPPH